MHPTGRAIYVPCGGAEKGPFFIGASNMSISIMSISITSISIIGILTTACPVHEGARPMFAWAKK